MKPLQISNDVTLCENAIFLQKSKTLIISDLQLGYEQQLRALGHNISYNQAKSMLELLETLIAQNGAKRLVINGDLKHEFGKINSQERHDILGLLKRLKRRIEIIVVKGNHDTLTKQLIEEIDLKLYDEFEIDGYYCIHGHKLPEQTTSYKKSHTIIIGHTHPAITINDGIRKERYKCFMIGKYKKKQLIVLPSFSTIVEGTDILNSKNFSPLIESIESNEVYVIADIIRPFGTVKILRKLLNKLQH